MVNVWGASAKPMLVYELRAAGAPAGHTMTVRGRPRQGLALALATREGGEVIGVSAIVSDITEARRAASSWRGSGA